jgi:tetratricopeptide (TPR) repeat protein
VSGWLSFIWARSLGRDPGGTKALATQPLVFKKLWARCRLRNGDTTGSITLWEEVMCLEDSLTEDHPDRLASQHELAMAYQANGQVKRAVALLEHVVKVKEGSLTEDHPSLLASQHVLAGAYRADGQVKRAVALLEHVVKVKEGSLREDHPSRLASQRLLFYMYGMNGQAVLV